VEIKHGFRTGSQWSTGMEHGRHGLMKGSYIMLSL
jgi:hypothetical protein